MWSQVVRIHPTTVQFYFYETLQLSIFDDNNVVDSRTDKFLASTSMRICLYLI
jgi:hypothetical protein